MIMTVRQHLLKISHYIRILRNMIAATPIDSIHLHTARRPSFFSWSKFQITQHLAAPFRRARPLSLRFLSLRGLLHAFRSSKTVDTSSPVLNQVLKGREASYCVLKSLTPCVFQAKVEGSSVLYVQLDDPNFQPMLTRLRVAIKIPPEEAIYPFLDEKNAYTHRSIRNSPYIRPLREYIDDPNNPCLVFEWMDNTLWETKDEPMEHKVGIFKIVAKSCLLGLLAVQKMNSHNQYCHAGEASVSRKQCDLVLTLYSI